MGTMRRSSTGLFNKVTSAVRKSNSKSDLKVDPNPPSNNAGNVDNVPSPVAESPAREAAAMEQDAAARGPHGVSPLVGPSVVPPSAGEEPSIAQVLQPAQSATSAEPMETSSAPASETQTVAPIAQPTNAPAAASAPESVPASTTPAPVPPPVAEPQPIPAPMNASMSAPSPPPVPASTVATAAEAETAVVADSLVESPESQLQSLPVTVIPHAPAVEKRGPDYFAWGDEDALNPSWKGKEPATVQPAPPPPTAVVAVDQGHADATPPRLTDAQAFAWKDDMTMPTKRSTTSLATGESVPQTMSSEPATRLGGISAKPSKSSMSSYGQVIVNPARRRMSVSLDPNDADARRGRSPGPNVRWE